MTRGQGVGGSGRAGAAEGDLNQTLTMAQVADELGLSRLTVSSVINGKAAARGIPERTVRRVQEHLQRIGYVPSRSAVALRMGRPGGTGILHSGNLFSHLTEAFNRLTNAYTASADGLEIMVGRRGELERSLRELLARGVRKLVWIHALPPEAEFAEWDRIAALLAKMRVVVYNYNFDLGEMDGRIRDFGIGLVGVSRKRGYEKLAAFVRRLGHRRVFLPDVCRTGQSGCSRQFAAAFAAQGVTPVYAASRKEEKIADLIERGTRLAPQILAARKNDGVTAACFRDDEVAGAAMAELLRRGVRIPDDLTVTGMDGHPLAAIFRVPLTTMAMPVAAMVGKTMQLLDGDGPLETPCCCDWELVARGSHARAG
ncbi:MAG: LacI family DNA-binding transcriptional regulator [Lentisphaeria bacterium]